MNSLEKKRRPEGHLECFENGKRVISGTVVSTQPPQPPSPSPEGEGVKGMRQLKQAELYELPRTLVRELEKDINIGASAQNFLDDGIHKNMDPSGLGNQKQGAVIK